MARGIGQLVVSLGLDAAEFVSGMSRAELLSKKSAERLERQLATGANAVGVAIGQIAVAAGGAAVAVDKLIKSVADFKDLEETTGASAEGLASLSLSAAVAGVEIGNVAGSMQKLTKSLTGVDDEGKAAGAALASIGINVAAFKRLDPVAQYEAIGAALSKFADGAEKTAVAQALFGKSGAEQLKVFKALEEQGGRTVTLTQAQIEAADKYADAQALAVAQLKQYAQVASVEFLPAMNDLLTVVTEAAKAFTTADTAAGKLAAQEGLREFADNLASTLAKLVDIAVATGKTFEVVGKTIGATFAIVAAARKGELEQARAISAELEADITRITTYVSLSERLDKQRAARQAAERAAAANPASYSNEGRNSAKPVIDYDGAQKDAAAKAKAARAERMKIGEEAARAELQLAEITAQETAEAWKFYNEIILRDEQASTDARAEMYRQWFAEIDAEQDRAIEEGKAFLETKTEELSEFMLQAQRNIQDVLGSSLEQALEGNFDNIGKSFVEMLRKMLAQAAAAQLAKAMFGDGKTDKGWFGALANAVGQFAKPSSAAAAPSTGGASIPRLSTGTNFVPRDMLAMLHKGESVVPKEYNPAAGGVRGGVGAGKAPNIVIENHGGEVQQKKDPNGDLRLVIKMAINEAAAGVASGTGPLSAAMKQRGLNLNGGISRRA